MNHNRQKTPFEASVMLAINAFCGFPRPKTPDQKVACKAYRKLIKRSKGE